MAPQPAAGAGVTRAPAGPRGWRGWHLFYHADRDLLLRGLVAPLAASLLAEGEAESVFFVRYGLGGPHVRLRVRPLPGRAAAAEARVRREAEAFFARCPSTVPLSDDAIHRQNRALLFDDPLLTARDDVVRPDNAVLRAPVRFEVERYGGPRLLRHSVDFFALSSVHVLRTLRRAGEPSAAARLAEASRATLRQAWGLARDAGQVGQLAAWAAHAFRGVLDGFAARGDEAFERGRDAHCARIRGELEALAEGDERDPDGAGWMGGAARRLAHELHGAGDDQRWRIGSSQVHMTANRLGLRNPEEVYLGRILQRAVDAVMDADPALRRRLADAHRAQAAATPPDSLRERTRATLAAFARGN
jgi:hypothetical protein